ncbi:CHAD domain-containing protein [Nakamurella lactea]|uniref:CHAD domain-containing protein n=1 Tax=Nakamurella lactea TaxID=459515 RepID=UPI000423AF41|nr:CHAD domain-containing protein [Nakamurella lactea]
MTAPAPRPSRRREGLLPTDVADALSEVLARATAAIRENEPGSRDGADIEHVHQMRVATRRIRAYLKAAKPALDPAAADRLRADLAELAGTLGEVRDLDVMIDRMHSEAAALGDPDTGALERLIGRLEVDRRAARGQLLAELDDASFGEMLAELDEAAAAPPVADPWADLKQLAGLEWEKLAKARAKLVSRFGDTPPDDDLHALRIYGKRARYAAELLTGPGGGGSGRRKGGAAIRRYLVALSVFQEVLGNHQDACVLEDQLRELVSDSDDTEAALAAGRVVEGCRERCVQARIEYPGAWEAVRAAAIVAFG